LSTCFDQRQTVLTNAQADGASETIKVLADAYEFARYNQYIADLAPLQLYASALVFAPDISIIKTRFRLCMPSWLFNPPRIEKSWRSDVLKFEGHTSVILAIAFSPDDKLLGTCSHDGTARVWDTTDTNCFLTLSYDKGYCSPYAVAFSSDSSKVAVAYIDFREESTVKVVVIVYSTRTGSVLRTMRCSGLLGSFLRLAVAFDDSDNDAIIAVVADVDQVQVWRMNESKMFVRAWTSHFDRRSGSHDPIDVGISQDASLLSWSGPGILDENADVRSSISVLDPKTRGVSRRYDWEEASECTSFCGSTLVCQVNRSDGALRFCLESCDVETPGETRHLLESQCPWQAFSLAKAEDRVAFSLYDDFIVHVEAIPESKRVGKPGLIDRQVVVAPRGDLVADWNHEALTVLDAQGVVTQKIEESFQSLRCLAISPDCRYIALGDKQGVTIWNIKTGKCSQQSEFKNLRALAFSNDNKTLACAGASLGVWDLESKPELVCDTAYEVERSDRLEFSADGQDLLTRRDRFHIATRTWTTHPESTRSSIFGREVSLASRSPKFGWDQWVKWVQLDDEDLLWIPEEYRTHWERSDARGNTVALGQEDGSLMTLTFDPSQLQSLPPSLPSHIRATHLQTARPRSMVRIKQRGEASKCSRKEQTE
jgi:WD40 repeat protein